MTKSKIELIQAGMVASLGAGFTQHLATVRVSEGIERALLERELRRFLVLCAVSPNVRYGACGPVDRAWHSFILFTRDYASYCGALGYFVHHIPASSAPRDEASAAYCKFLEDYAVTFGEQPPGSIWPSRLSEPVVVAAKMILDGGIEFCMDEPEAGGSIRA